MKKTILLTATACILSLNILKADNDRVIQSSELPTTAQNFLKTHFSNSNIIIAKVDKDFWDKDYNVIFKNGDQIEFDRKGNWKEVKCKNSQVPTAIVPKEITNYLKTNYPNEGKIISIDRDRKDYEVKLSNGWELKFDLQYRLIDIDK